MSRMGPLETPPPASVRVGGGEVRAGSRVRLRPRPRGDVMDAALAGRTARVDAIDQDAAGRLHVAVTLEDDPGRGLGEARHPAHRFYFAPEELEAAPPVAPDATRRFLVAGIGNLFLGDDGFGVAVARRLALRPQPPGVEVVDFGIRGMDLVHALQRDYDGVVLVDATPRGGRPGTLYVIEPEPGDGGEATFQAHGLDPLRALRLARALGARLDSARVRIVGCEPARVPDADAAPETMTMELSAPVRGALEGALALVEAVLGELGAPAPGGDAPHVDAPPTRREDP